LPPAGKDKYTILLKTIEGTSTSTASKDLASQVVRLSKAIDRLISNFESSVNKVSSGNLKSMEVLTRTLDKRLAALERIVSSLSSVFTKLSNAKDKPSADTSKLINQVVSEVVAKKEGFSKKYDSYTSSILKELSRSLSELNSNLKTTPNANAIQKQLYTAIEAVYKKDIQQMYKAITELKKVIGYKETGTRASKQPPVEVGGKILTNAGTEFEKIAKELRRKIVVMFDLETSKIEGGLPSRVKHIRQIGYQKGTLAQIREGKAERGNIYIKPPKEIQELYKAGDIKTAVAKYKEFLGDLGKANVDFEKELKSIMESGKDVKVGMEEFAEVLKNSSAVIGHNIAKFDLVVLNKILKEVGVKLEGGLSKYIDSLAVAEREFPARVSRSLESFEKDFKAAGIRIKQVGEGAHDARQDVEVLRHLIKAFDKKSKEFLAAKADFANSLSIVSGEIRKLSSPTKRLSETVDKLADKFDETGGEVKNVKKSIKKAKDRIEKMSLDIKDVTTLKSGLQTLSFKGLTIKPSERGMTLHTKPGIPGMERTAAIVNDVSKSLYKLQQLIVDSLKKGLSSGMQIVSDEAGNVFNLAKGGREYEIKIANVRDLRKELEKTYDQIVPKDATPQQLITAFTNAFVRKEFSSQISTDKMAEEVAVRLRSMGSDEAASFGRIVDLLYNEIKSGKLGVSDIAGRKDLYELYKSLVLETKAQDKLNEDFIRRIAIPAAKISSQGIPVLETKYGSQKVLSNFATVTTGLERLVDELKAFGARPMDVLHYQQLVAEAPIRPTPGGPEEAKATKLAEDLINKVVQLGGQSFVREGYQKAVALRKLETGEFTKKQAQNYIQTQRSLEEVRKEAEKLKVSALDVAKALDSVNFENFYDLLGKMLTKGDKIPFLERQASKLGRYDASVRRGIASVVNELQGLLPLIEPGRVKRAPYQQDVLRVFTKSRLEELRPEEQKKAIIDINLLWKDIAERATKLQEPLVPGKEYLGSPVATSLDLSDAASSELKQFIGAFDSHVKELGKTMTSMSIADIRSLAPFKDFSSIQRQMSYTTAAIGGGVIGKKGIEPLETPRLLSEREKKFIESGKYGEGYGLNVLTELRQTAGTFEDQILIAGRLAKTFTSLTKTLVAPAAKIAEEGIVSEIQPGVQRITPRAARFFERDLNKVVDKFQEVLGVPKKYRGRADLAEIGKEIVNVIREHRGETIEVQTAKLTEYFLNYFGRKFATRFGTKGVSVAVKPGEALGYAKVQKTAGELLAELITSQLKTVPKEFEPEIKALTKSLRKYGNAFMIDLFTDAKKGIVTPDVAKSMKDIFTKASDVIKDLFDKDLKPGIEGLKDIKELYIKRFGDKRALYRKLPIEARISSRGIAKRGLMTEVLEGMVNNLLGATAQGPITIKDILPKKAFMEGKKGREKINQYLSALGYEKIKDFNEVIKRLKLEKPDIDPDTVKKLREFEKQWNVYTEVTDEFGKKIQSFVAPKFLQVIEEPHLYKEWSGGELEKGLKGLKLDYQSFAAYLGIFGEGSSMIKELGDSLSVSSREGFELIKTFQLLDPSMKKFREQLLKAIPEVSIDSLKVFEKSTGTLEDFKNTVFDISKFPTAFSLKIPSTVVGAKEAYENIYVPGAQTRKVYQEELLSKNAPTNFGRYLDNLINAAKRVNDLYKIMSSEGRGLSEEYQRKFSKVIKQELVDKLTKNIKLFRQWEKRGPTEDQVSRMREIIDKFKQVLSEKQAPVVYQGQGAVTEREVVSRLEQTVKGPYKFSTVLGRIADLLVGANPEALEKERQDLAAALKQFRNTGVVPERYKGKLRYYGGDFEKLVESFSKRIEEKRKAPTIFDVRLETGGIDELAAQLGINIKQTVEEALNEAKESLSKAKIRYYTELGRSVIGKKKGIEEAFFRRTAPAITGKAVVAVTDKASELNLLLDKLSKTKHDINIDIPNFDRITEKLKKLKEEHLKQLKRAKELGMPVLHEGEIGISPHMAQKLKVFTGEQNKTETSLANLIKQQKTFVESVRYPFTGTLSVQPHIAKLTESLPSKYSIAVPGIPQLDLAELNKIIQTLREIIGVVPKEKRVYTPKEQKSLIEQREEAWAKNTEEGANRARELTTAIEELLKAVNAATPKFTNLEQKLDFDGDALFVHTGRLKESRDEIERHYNALQDDTTSVRSLFRSVFSAVKEGETRTLSEMAYIFGKKHPKEKGFEFLTKPYLRENVSNLRMPEVMRALFSYEDAAKNFKSGTSEWNKAFDEWSKQLVKTTLLPEAVSKLGVPKDVEEQYLAKVEESKYGFIKATNNLEEKIDGLIREIARQQLWEKKYSDAIAGQLYKLHTGQTVEGVSRLLRISETETGFGRGVAGTGKNITPPSEEFLSKWPKTSVVLGNRPVQAFASRMNEILRFIIQKGMDVKHAGVKAVGQLILERIGKKGGVKEIMDAIKKHSDDFGELLDFEQEIINEAKLRLGKLSTPELQRELALFEPDIDITKLTTDRKKLISSITKHINLEATFEELFRQIKRQAVKGLKVSYERQLKELPEGPSKARIRRDISAIGGVDLLAKKRVEEMASSEKGIPLPLTVVSNLQPLYQMRTRMETLGTVSKRSLADVQVPKMILPEGEAGKEFADKLRVATKAAAELTSALERSATGVKRGIYGTMFSGALKARYKELTSIEEFVNSLKSSVGGISVGEQGPERMVRGLISKLGKEFNTQEEDINLSNLDEYLSKYSRVQKVAKEQVGKIYEMAGLPPITPQEEAELKETYMRKFAKEIKASVNKFVNKAVAASGEQLNPEEMAQTVAYVQDKMNQFFEDKAVLVEQLRRVMSVVKTVPLQKAYIQKILRGTDLSKPFKNYVDTTAETQKAISDEYTTSTKDVENWYRVEKVIKEAKQRIEQSRKQAESLESTAVDVYDELVGGINKALIRDKVEALRALVDKARGGAKTGKSIELYNLYRASGLHGGGGYGGGSQLEAIVGEMVGKPKDLQTLLELTSARGEFIHRQIQREFLAKYPTAEIEKPLEDFENNITGHLDVLYEEGGKKLVADIKTIYSKAQFDRLKEIADEIKNRNISIQDKLKELKSQDVISNVDKHVIRRLEDYLSQVNVYLKNVEGSVGEIIAVSTLDPSQRVVIPIGEFDPSRFKKDVEIVKKARARVEELVNNIRAGKPIPEELFSDMPEIYDYISKNLKDLGPNKFLAKLPKRLYGEKQKSPEEILSTLTKEEEEKGKQLTSDLLDYYKRIGGVSGGAEEKFKIWLSSGGGGSGIIPPPPGGAAPPPTGPPPAGGAGGGFDDDGYLTELQAILAKLQREEDITIQDKIRIGRLLDELKARIVTYSKDASNRDLVERMASVLREFELLLSDLGIDEREIASFERQYQKLREATSKGTFGSDVFRKIELETKKAHLPEAKHKNLKAMLLEAIRYYQLGDTEEAKKFGPEITNLLKDVREQGPSADITKQIREALDRLPPEKRGGFMRVWMLYRKEVGQYFIRRLDELKKKIEEEGSGAEGQRLYEEYKSVVDKYLRNIELNLGKKSDIYTTTKGRGSRRDFISPDIAQVLGIYKEPEQIKQLVSQRNLIKPKYKPILDMFTSDLTTGDFSSMISPLEKVRTAFEMLANLDPKIKTIISDIDLFGRKGAEAIKGWDVTSLAEGTTELRNALESYLRLAIGGFGGPIETFTEESKKNIEDVIKYLKQLEKSLQTVGAKSELNLLNVPQFLSPEMQRLMHKRNIAAVREYFKRPQEEGGPEIGKAFTYRYKVIDPATKQALDSISVEFKKIGEESVEAGKKIGIITEKTEDLIKLVQGRRGFGQAFGRVIRWGVASRTVYGLVNAFKEMVNVIADVQTGMAVLKQVMNPLVTNFAVLQNSAVQFAKEFGLPIRQVIDSMRVFAQQGLAQSEVIDRTRSSLLAANVTTLAAEDATEALTAAVKVYGQEGESTVKFLDAWTQVESRHAITSKNLALALRKSAAAAKNAGVTFDQLNAIVTGIGETTRQTGNEIGTSLRFVFRRLYSKNAPKALAGLQIPTVGEAGEIRSAFDILGDLAGKWDELTSAQRMNLATAIGGRRHYNSVIVLMEHWGDVLNTLQDSIDSTGASERRNAIIMETYSKKLQQLRAAVVELQLQFGKYALPIATKFVSGLKTILEVISNLSPAVKIGAAALAGFFFTITKGQRIMATFSDYVTSFTSIFDSLKSDFFKKLGFGIFEVFGKLPKMFGGLNTEGLNVIGKSANSIRDLTTILGKSAYLLVKFGRAWNQFLSILASGGGDIFNVISKAFGGMGAVIASIAAGLGFTGKVFTKVVGIITSGAIAGKNAFDSLAQLAGEASFKMEEWAGSNTTFVKSMSPLAASLLGIVPLVGKLSDEFKKVMLSAHGYEKSLSGVRQLQSKELSNIGTLIKEYDNLTRRLTKVSKVSRTPAVAAATIVGEEYISPLLEYDTITKKFTGFANTVAKVMPELVLYFDKFGNAVLRGGINYRQALDQMRGVKLNEIAETNIKALEKFARELTNASTFSAKFRSEIKKFINEVPMLGPILSKFITVSPAQQLKEAIDDMNKIVGARSPLSPVYDKLFKDYYEQLETARKNFEKSYKRFRQLLSELPSGLSSTRLVELLGRKVFMPMYDMIIEQRRSLKALSKKGLIDARDILGIEVMRKLHPERSFDYAGPITKELLRQSKIIQRKGKMFAGDTVLFVKDIDKYIKAAGQVGIAKFRDGIGWVVEVFDKELLSVREIPLEHVEKFIDSVFPATRIVDAIDRNLDLVKENLTGAAAGMVGFTQTEFKKLYNLGPQFFEQIPTEVLLQTSRGININTGAIGESPLKARVPEIAKQYITLMDQLSKMIETPQKRLEAGAGLTKGAEKRIEEVQKLIMNTQVYLQFIRVIADLEKTVARTTRVLEENVALQQERNRVIVESSGLLKGVSTEYKEIQSGAFDVRKLTLQQLQLAEESLRPKTERPYTERVKRLQAKELELGANAQIIESLVRASKQIEYILKSSKESGIVMTQADISALSEAVSVGVSPLQSRTLNIQTDIKKGVFQTVSKLEDLISITKGEGLSVGAEKVYSTLIEEMPKLTKFRVNPLQTNAENAKLKTLFDRLVKLRALAVEKQRPAEATKIDQLVKVAGQQLVATVGLEKAIKFLGSNYPITNFARRQAFGGLLEGPMSRVDYLSKARYSPEELLGQIFNVKSLQGFITAIESASELPETRKKYTRTAKIQEEVMEFIRSSRGVGPITQSKEFKALKAELSRVYAPSYISSKTLTKMFLSFSGFMHIFKKASEREAKYYELQLNELKEQKDALKAKFLAGGIDKEEYRKKVTPLVKEISKTSEAYKESQKTFKNRATLRAVGVLGGALTTFARQVGISEKALKFLGGSAMAGVLAYTLWSKVVGKETPEVIKKATSSIKNVASELRGFEGAGTLKKSWLAVKTRIPFTDLYKARKEAEAAGEFIKSQGLDKEMFTKTEKEKIRKFKEIDKKVDAFKKADAKKLTTQEEAVKEAKNQTTLLMGIEANTRKSAKETKGREDIKGKKVVEEKSGYDKIKEKIDRLRKEQLASGGNVIDKMKDVLAAILLATAGGYAGSKTELGSNIGIAAKQRKRISKLVVDLMEKYPEELPKILSKYAERREEIRLSPLMSKAEKTVNIDKAYKELKNQITNLIKAREAAYTATNEAKGLALAYKRLAEVGTSVTKSFLEFFGTIRDQIVDFTAEFNANARQLGAAAGLPTLTEITPVKTLAELTPTELGLKVGGPHLRKLYINKRSVSAAKTQLVATLKDIMKSASNTTATIATYFTKIGSNYDNMSELMDAHYRNMTRLVVDKASKYDKYAKLIDQANKNVEKAEKHGGAVFEKAVFQRNQLLEKQNRILEDSGALAAKASQIRLNVAAVKQTKDKTSFTKELRAQLEQQLALVRARKEQGKALKQEYLEQLKLAKTPVERQRIQDVYRDALTAINSDVRRQTKDMKDILTEPFSEIDKESKKVSNVLDLLSSSQDTYRRQVEKLKEVIDDVNAWERAASLVEQITYSFATLSQTAEKLRSNLEISRYMDSFAQSLDEMRSKLLGGSYPTAPQYPSADVAMQLLQAGVPQKDLFTMNKYQLNLVQKGIQQGYITEADRWAAEYNKRRDVAAFKNQQTYRNLSKELDAGQSMLRSLVSMQKRLEELGQTDAASRLGELVKVLESSMSRAYEVIGLGPSGEMKLQGFNATEFLSVLQPAFKQLLEEAGTKSEILNRQLEDLKKELAAKSSVDKLSNIYSVLNSKIATGIGGIQDLLTILIGLNSQQLKKIAPGLPEYSMNISNIAQALTRSGIFTTPQPIEQKAVGGKINGPGGPKSDKIPILASNGEYVIKADSVKRLGVGVLDYINQKGELPLKFNEGGAVDSKTKGSFPFIGDLSKLLSTIAKKVFGTADEFSIYDRVKQIQKRKEQQDRIMNELFDKKAEGGIVDSSNSFFHTWWENIKNVLSTLAIKTVGTDTEFSIYDRVKQIQKRKEQQERTIEELFGKDTEKKADGGIVVKKDKRGHIYMTNVPREDSDVSISSLKPGGRVIHKYGFRIWKDKTGQLHVTNVPAKDTSYIGELGIDDVYKKEFVNKETPISDQEISTTRLKTPVVIDRPNVLSSVVKDIKEPRVKEAGIISTVGSNYPMPDFYSEDFDLSIPQQKPSYKPLYNESFTKDPVKFLTSFADYLEEKRIKGAYKAKGFWTIENWKEMLKAGGYGAVEMASRGAAGISALTLALGSVLKDPSKSLKNIFTKSTELAYYLQSHSLEDVYKDIVAKTSKTAKFLKEYYSKDVSKGGTRLTSELLIGALTGRALAPMSIFKPMAAGARGVTKLGKNLGLRVPKFKTTSNILDSMYKVPHRRGLLRGIARLGKKPVVGLARKALSGTGLLRKKLAKVNYIADKGRIVGKFTDKYFSPIVTSNVKKAVSKFKSRTTDLSGIKAALKDVKGAKFEKSYMPGIFEYAIENLKSGQLTYKGAAELLYKMYNNNRGFLQTELKNIVYEGLMSPGTGKSIIKHLERGNIEKLGRSLYKYGKSGRIEKLSAFKKPVDPLNPFNTFSDIIKAFKKGNLSVVDVGNKLYELSQSIGDQQLRIALRSLVTKNVLPKGMFERLRKHGKLSSILKEFKLKELAKGTAKTLFSGIKSKDTVSKLFGDISDKHLAAMFKYASFKESLYGGRAVGRSVLTIPKKYRVGANKIVKKGGSARPLGLARTLSYINRHFTEFAMYPAVFAAFPKEQYQEGGLVNPVEWWSKKLTGYYEPVLPWWSKKILGVSKKEGDTFSVNEAASRLQERKEERQRIMEELFGKKAEGGFISNWEPVLPWWKNWFKELLFGKTDPKLIKIQKALTGKLTRERVKEALGEDIESYRQGTPYVPQDQLAIVHKGEAIIPAKYNFGGEITDSLQKFALGGVVSAPGSAVNFESAAEKIGDIIAKKIADVDIELQPPKTEDLPKLEISNLDELKDIFGTGPVGATKISKLDQFIEMATDKLDRLEDQVVVTSDKIKEIETKSVNIDDFSSFKDSVNELSIRLKGIEVKTQVLDNFSDVVETVSILDKNIVELKSNTVSISLFKSIEQELVSIKEEVESLYTKRDRFVDKTEDQSYVDTKLHEAISEIKNTEVNPLRAGFDRLASLLNDLSFKIDSHLDVIYSNIDRLGLV